MSTNINNNTLTLLSILLNSSSTTTSYSRTRENNSSIFSSRFQSSQNNSSLFNQDYSRMSLAQLQATQVNLISQSAAAAENYPELAAQYGFLDKKLQTEISKRLLGGVSEADKNTALSQIDSNLNKYQVKLQQIQAKRAVLANQAQAAAENYPELAAKYQFLDKKLETERMICEQQIKALQAHKIEIQNSNTSSTNQNQSNQLINIIMMLLQAMFKS